MYPRQGIMKMLQLELFLEPLEKRYDRDMNIMKDKYENLRKSQHSRISVLQKEIKDLKNELEFLKSHICKNGLFL